MFKTIHDLSALSNEAREKYLRDVSIHFGVDPEANLFDMIWMNQEDGTRKLIAYARRGTTDILRAQHGIHVTSMRSEENGSTIRFIVSGKDKAGREEFSSGSCSIEGLKGERRSAAEMTAQTRALRRLTLQFVGGGILDVSEVDSKTTDINSAPGSLAQLAGNPMPPAFMPPPTTAPNNAPGKLVEAPSQPDIKTDTPHSQIPPMALEPTVSESPKTDIQPDIQTNLEPIKKPRGRRRKNTVDLSLPGQTPVPMSIPQQIEIPTGVIDNQGKISEPTAKADLKEGADGNGVKLPLSSTETTPKWTDPSPGYRFKTSEELSKEDLKAMENAPLPFEIAPEKIKAYRERLNKYISDILPREGKMMPSEGIGGTPNKLRKFAFVFNGVDDVKKLTEDQWEQFLGFLDSYYQANGAIALTAYINTSIGAQS